MGEIRVLPWSVKKALPFVADVHRHLPRCQGARWALRLERAEEVVGCALVGEAARVWPAVLAVKRVAVIEGVPNGCSMLLGACSRAAKAMGAEDLVTYTLEREPGTSLRAAGWVYGGLTDGGEHHRPSRHRAPATEPGRKHRWFARWGQRAQRILDDTETSHD